MSSTLVDWAPALEIAGVGLLLASLPLLWLAWRMWREGGWDALRSPLDWQRALTLATLLLTLDLVVFGAFTRLTDSGLGCPDWPGCYGTASPVTAHAEIAQAQAVAPHGPVTHQKAWIEMIHRYLATMVGALITGLMLLAWWRSRGPTTGSHWWPTLTFIWVCLQGAFGALTVTLKLYPLVVSLHLLGGLLGVSLLAAQTRWLMPARPGGIWQPVTARLVPFIALVWLVWMMQSGLGAWVSTNGAVLVCSDVPTCQGQWWPPMDWQQGFVLFRHAGMDGQGGAITLPALTAIHMAHRLGAVVTVALVLWLCWLLHRHGCRGHAWRVAALLVWQVLAGLSNVVLSWPLLAALAHTLGAAMMATYLVWISCSAGGAFAPRDAATARAATV